MHFYSDKYSFFPKSLFLGDRLFPKESNFIQRNLNKNFIKFHSLITSNFFIFFIWFIFYKKAEEEARSLQKKIQTVENELDQTQEALTQVNAKLDEKNKALQNVSTCFLVIYSNYS